MPPKIAAAALSENELFLLAVIKHNVSGTIKYDKVSTELGGDKSVNALRKKFTRLRDQADAITSGAANGTAGSATDGVTDAAGEEETGPVKPAAAKKKRATVGKKNATKPAAAKKNGPVVKKRKRVAVEEADVEEAAVEEGAVKEDEDADADEID